MTIKLGYGRVSTDKEEGKEQTLGQQIDKLTEAGVDPENIYTEKISGKINLTHGPKWLALKERIISSEEPVDLHMVDWSRLARQGLPFQNAVAELREHGCVFTIVGDPRYQQYAPADAMDEMMLAWEAFGAQMYRERISKSTKAKLHFKRDVLGETLGRPKKLTAEDCEFIARLTANGHGYGYIVHELTKRRVKAIPAEVKLIEADYVKAIKHAVVSKTTVADEVRRQQALAS